MANIAMSTIERRIGIQQFAGKVETHQRAFLSSLGSEKTPLAPKKLLFEIKLMLDEIRDRS